MKTPPDDTASTSAEILTRRLREDIVAGLLKPATKLQLRELQERYGFGTSPIREALSRLTTEGFVTAAAQRGFRVAAASREDLLEILEFRKVVEGAALRLSVERGGEDWELAVVTAMHRLKKHAQQPAPRDPAWMEEWETLHKGYHMTLISACGSRRMQETSSRLYDETVRYRHLYYNYDFAAAELIAEHTQFTETVLSRDAERSVRTHAEHMDLTLAVVEKLTPDI